MDVQIYPFVDIVGGVLRPYIPIKIINPATRTSQSVFALIDTGADCCVFPKWVADKLGYNVYDGTPGENQGLGDGAIKVWLHPVKIELLSPTDRSKTVWKSKEIQVRYVDHDNVPPLLGFSDFIGHFKVAFNLSSKRITIQSPL